MSHVFADRDRWDSVAAALQRATDRGELVGLDTEFYGADYDVRKASPAGGRARVHMWSIAVKRHPLRLTPRGYHEADSAVLLEDALAHHPIREWLESSAPKIAHNLSVDAHALRSCGVTLAGAVDSLEWSRWVWPERARGRGFSLDSLGSDVVGVGKAESFTELFSEDVELQLRTKLEKRTTCDCGVDGCRKRKGHVKTVTTTEVPVMRTVKRRISLDAVTPGHERWDRAVAYAARDAVLALNLADTITREMKRSVPWPW